jgi:hypothetical protein
LYTGHSFREQLVFNLKLLNMKKLAYLFVMIAGMTLAAVNVNAQDAKSTAAPVKTEAKATCCKSGDKACCKKDAASTCTKKDATTTSQNVTDKKGSCCKAKTEASASDVKSTKSVN